MIKLSLSQASEAMAQTGFHGRYSPAHHRQEGVVDQTVRHWVTVERFGVAPGDLVSAEAGGLPIYRVLMLQGQRASLRDERSGRDHISPLHLLRWKVAA